MQAEHNHSGRRPGICYAPTVDGPELPVIDITHPAFAVVLSPAGEEALQARYMEEVASSEKAPPFLRKLIFGFMRRRSIIMRGLMGADGTFMSGMNTYLMKLGPDNLAKPTFSEIDRRIAASAAGTYMRVRLQDVAGLLAGALAPRLEAQPAAPLHLLNIGGGSAIDSLNALILLRRDHPDRLAARQVGIHSLDLDSAGAGFGARALDALLAEGGPLHSLDARFKHIAYNWSDPAALRDLLGRFEGHPAVVAASSEGALFEYGTDEDITANLSTLSAHAPAHTLVVGTVTRADTIGLRANGAGVGSRAAIHFRGIDAFAALAGQSGWQMARRVDRPLSHAVLLEHA